jgi:hypothetical protein
MCKNKKNKKNSARLLPLAEEMGREEFSVLPVRK